MKKTMTTESTEEHGKKQHHPDYFCVPAWLDRYTGTRADLSASGTIRLEADW
jgi:hypothetical protein